MVLGDVPNRHEAGLPGRLPLDQSFVGARPPGQCGPKGRFRYRLRVFDGRAGVL